MLNSIDTDIGINTTTHNTTRNSRNSTTEAMAKRKTKRPTCVGSTSKGVNRSTQSNNSNVGNPDSTGTLPNRVLRKADSSHPNALTGITTLPRSLANCSRRHYQFTLLVTNNITTVVTKTNVNGLFSSSGSVLNIAPLGSFLAFLNVYINIVVKLTVLVPNNVSRASFGQQRPCIRSFCTTEYHPQREITRNQRVAPTSNPFTKTKEQIPQQTKQQ